MGKWDQSQPGGTVRWEGHWAGLFLDGKTLPIGKTLGGERPCVRICGMVEQTKSDAAAGRGATHDPDGLRRGETAVALPPHFDASLYFIGRIHTPWTRREDCPKNARESDAVCTIALDPRWAEGLNGLESASHVIVLYWMDHARRDLVRQAPRDYAEQRGTFALRSPLRPNPIALSVARLVRIEANTLCVIGLDCLDNTPLLDIKPYFASTDSVPDASVGWHAKRKR
jgi:tRNA-Thr(GGU) m(6)t(6)A37 methyltransferase TsaA